jgi:hypothetical protein
MIGEIITLVQETHISVSVSAIVILLVSLSVCLLMRLNSAGLIIAYLFTLHMGWLFCQRELLAKLPGLERYAVIYFVFGGVVLLLAVFGIMQNRGRKKE